MGRRDRDPALALFRGLVDLVEGRELRQTLMSLTLRDRRRQRRLAMIHVTDRSHVHVRLRPLELRLGQLLVLLFGFPTHADYRRVRAPPSP